MRIGNTPAPGSFTPACADFEARTRASFGLQRVMKTIGAELVSVSAGEVVIAMPFREDLAQQHGYIHAAMITAIVDSACGFAAYTLMPESVAVLTTEYKVNFLAPAEGQTFLAYGRVIKAGRTLTVCAGDVVNQAEKPVATMLATMMTVTGRGITG